MKFIKSIMASVLALSVVTSVSAADITLYITGSSAYRANTDAAIGHLIVPGTLMIRHNGGTGSSKFAGASKASIYGTLTNAGTLNGQTIQVLTSWTGSEAGIASLTKTNASAPDGYGVLTTFISPSTDSYAATISNDNTATVTWTSTDGGSTSGIVTADAYPNIALSDTLNATSQFKPNAKYQGVVYSGLTEATGGAVGIVPFVWIATTTTNGGAAISNITTQNAKALFGGAGYLSLNNFTGNASDTVSYVFALGRNPESGTRLTTFAEIGAGATATTKQYMPVAAGNSTTTDTSAISATGVPVAVLAPWPTYTSSVTSKSVASPNGGYDSGGSLCKAIANSVATMTVASVNGSTFAVNTLSGVTGTLIAYTGINDAATLIGSNSLNKLQYNGVELPLVSGVWDFTPIKTGKYSFWGYEHLYYKTSATATVSGYATYLASQLRTVDAQIILDSTVLVKRTTDGGTVIKN